MGCHQQEQEKGEESQSSVTAERAERSQFESEEKLWCMTFRSANVAKLLISMQKVVRAGNTAGRKESAHPKHSGWNSDQAGREQRCAHDGLVKMKHVRFSAGRDSEWSSCFRQACDAGSIVQRCNDRKQKSRVKKQNLDGVVEERDEMSDEEGNVVDGVEELAAPDWRVRSSRNKPTQRETEEATRVPFRDWCVHSMMGRGRTHHYVAKQKSEDQSRRCIIAMGYIFMRMESAPNVQAISEESMICVAVKEDRHQNIMSSVALKKGLKSTGHLREW